MLQNIKNTAFYCIGFTVISTAAATYKVVDDLLMRDLKEDLARKEKIVAEQKILIKEEKEKKMELTNKYAAERSKLAQAIEENHELVGNLALAKSSVASSPNKDDVEDLQRTKK